MCDNNDDPQQTRPDRESFRIGSGVKVLLGVIAGILSIALLFALQFPLNGSGPPEAAGTVSLMTLATVVVAAVLYIVNPRRPRLANLRMYALGFCLPYCLLVLLAGCCAVMVSGVGH